MQGGLGSEFLSSVLGKYGFTGGNSVNLEEIVRGTQAQKLTKCTRP